MKTSSAGAPFRDHTLMKHNPGRNRVVRCGSRTSIALKFSQMSCSGYRPLKDIFSSTSVLMMISPGPSPPLENEMQFRSQQFQPIKGDPAVAINAESREGYSSR